MSARRVGFAAWAALIFVQLAWYGWLAPPQGGPSALALAIALPPLLLPLLALRRGPDRALLWIGIVSLAHFCHGVVAAWAEADVRGLALTEVALCVLLTGALGAQAIASRRRTRAATGKT